MKNRILLLLILIIGLSCTQKGGKDKSAQQKNSSTEIPVMVFKEEMVDLGHVVAGEILLHNFTFRNTGDADLVIEKIEGDCSCTTGKAMRSTVPPGEKGTIEVEFDSSGLYGRQYKTIEVYNNTGELKHLVIFAIVENKNLEINY